MSLSTDSEQNNLSNNKKSKKTLNSENKNNSVIEFNEKELDLFSEVTEQDLGMDNEDFSDLKELPEEKELSDKELDDIIEDKSIKTLVRDEQDTPQITDTLKSNEDIGRLTNEEVLKIKKDYIDEKNNLIVWLAAKSTITLHVYAGNRDGKAIWVEKDFRFNSLNKRQEMELNMLNSRVKTISVRNTIIANKQLTTITDEEKEFLQLAPMMIEVAAYRLSEKEAKMRLGMTPDDFAKVQADEYSLALQVLQWRTQNVPYYKRGR